MKSIVAIILATGVSVVLIRHVWVADLSGNIEMTRMMKELLLVIVGVLAGYISSRGRNDE
jgi:hypothetical protein